MLLRPIRAKKKKKKTKFYNAGSTKKLPKKNYNLYFFSEVKKTTISIKLLTLGNINSKMRKY